MSNHRSAYNAWIAIKKKLFGGDGPPTASATPKKRQNSTPKAKGKKKVGSDGEEDHLEVEAPAKKKKRTPAKPKQKTPAPVVHEAQSDEDAKVPAPEDDEIKVERA